MKPQMKLNAIAPWFGGKRTMAPVIIEQLGPHSYYFEGCFGGLSIIFGKEPSEHECVCDLHGGVTNLALCVQRDDLAAEIFDRLQRTLYSDELYGYSKEWLEGCEPKDDVDRPVVLDADWAYHYFIASWMGRNGVAGTERANYQIATRWTSGGGSGPLRFRNAVDSIPAWCERLRNVQILRRDMFDLLGKIEDAPGTVIYVDPPYLAETMSGKSRYLHNFEHKDHMNLCWGLRKFKKARVIVSYYAHPSLEIMYPGWNLIDCSRHKHLHCQTKRVSTRTEAPEVLLINGPILSNEKTDLFS